MVGYTVYYYGGNMITKRSRKQYVCFYCGKQLNRYYPIRIVVKEHEDKETYGNYISIANYDFCKPCFKKVERLLSKGVGYEDKER